MVSLENRSNYLLRINESPKLSAFNNLLLNKNILVPSETELNESDMIYFGLVDAIQTKNQTAFESFYNKKSKSNPSKESPSPFVNDDFLIFCLIVGIMKFGLDQSWIKNIISLRSRSPITITLENLITENYYSKSNIPELILVFSQINNPSLITNDFLNIAYNAIINNIALFDGKNDFQILCAMRAYDIIIELKETPDGGEIQLLKDFNSKFVKRIKILSWVIQTTLIILLLYFIIKIFSYNPKYKEFFDKINSVFKTLGLLGISQLGNVFPFIKRIINQSVLQLLGYPKALIKKDFKKD